MNSTFTELLNSGQAKKTQEELHFLLSDKVDLGEYFKNRKKIPRYINTFKNFKLAKKIHRNQLKLVQGVIVHFCDLTDYSSIIRSDRNGGSTNNAQLAQTIIKGLIALDAAILLIQNGHYGAAKAISRQTLEFCILAKFCALFPKQNKYEKWLNNGDIALGKEILSQIKTPALKKFWNDLSNFNHATPNSGQVTLGQIMDKDLSHETLATTNIVLASQAILFHLINSVAMTPRLKNYIFNYTMRGRRKNYDTVRDMIKSDIRQFKNEFATKHLQKIIYEYERDWKNLLNEPSKEILEAIKKKKSLRYEKQADLFLREIFHFSLIKKNEQISSLILKTPLTTTSWSDYLLNTKMFSLAIDEDTGEIYIQIDDEYIDEEESGTFGWELNNKDLQRQYQKGLQRVSKPWFKKQFERW